MGFVKVEVEIKEIKELLSMLNRKIDLLIGDRETLSMMKLAEISLKAFFEGEPELYSFDDVKVRYR